MALSIKYIISSTFPYERLICSDAGPDFARSYGWEYATVDTLLEDSSDVYVIDTRLTQQDVDVLAKAIRNQRKFFFLRLTDPYIYFLCSYWYQFVLIAMELPNVRIMSTYSPSGVVALFFSRAIGARFIYAPYVYDASREVDISHAQRSRKLLISGSIEKLTYPVRFAIKKHARLPPLRLLSETLAHPGYPDIGHKLSHNTIGASYIDRLSRYRFSLVCSSSMRVEFLKYTEIAYAGAVPVGDMPFSLEDCPHNAWIPWKNSSVQLCRKLLSVESEEMATQYRIFIRAKRDRAKVQKEVEARMLSTL